jgi:hypothetical protein
MRQVLDYNGMVKRGEKLDDVAYQKYLELYGKYTQAERKSLSPLGELIKGRLNIDVISAGRTDILKPTEGTSAAGK